MEYFELPYRSGGKERWLVYFTNDHDGVATDKDGKVLSFSTPQSVQEYCKKKKWKVQPATQTIDFDQIDKWLKKVDGENLDCPALYTTWNLFGDIATSLGRGDQFQGYQEDAMSIHEELFWGCNLPGMAPPDRPYKARLSELEVETLQEVLQAGKELFFRNVKEV